MSPQDRNMDHLHARMRECIEPWHAAVTKKGYKYLLYETFRTAERQAFLYAQGRTRPGQIVTYTLDSAHEYGVATDGVPLLWNPRTQAWEQDWSHAAYDRIYTAVPPSKFGMELLSWEKPHLQLKGVNGADQQQPARIWAAQQGIVANQIIGSMWPLPVPTIKPKPVPVPVPVPIAATPPPSKWGRILVPNQAGQWIDARGQRVVLAATGDEVILNATAEDGDVYLGGLYYPER